MKLNWNPPEINKTHATYSWNVPYAAVVHEGCIRPDGTRMPDRPWTDEAIAETDLEEVMAENFSKTKDIGEAFDDTAHYLAGQFEYVIRDDRWEWDRTTDRANGSTADSPRNIVDMGGLVDSQKLEVD